MASTGQFQICCNGNLQVDLHLPGFRGLFQRPRTTASQQFNTRGITLTVDRYVPEGSTVVLDLQVLDLRVEEVRGVVHSCQNLSNGQQRLRIEFRSPQRRDTRHCLKQLETLCLQQAEPTAAAS